MADNKKFVRRHFFIDRKFQGRYMVTFLIHDFYPLSCSTEPD
jgi:hypothetical protein